MKFAVKSIVASAAFAAGLANAAPITLAVTTGDQSLFFGSGGFVFDPNTLTGFRIDEGSYAMFAQAVGLTVQGPGALLGVTGSIASVPEPSSYAMMTMGLIAIGAAACRRKASASQPTTTHQD